jgi:hypothetical protein
VLDRIHRVADGPDDVTARPGQKVTGLPRLEFEESIIQTHGAENFPVAYPPPLDTQQGRIAFGLQLFDGVVSPGGVRRGIFVDDEIRRERRLAHHEIG